MSCYYVLVVFSVFAAACAQMLLKQGAKNEYESFISQYLNPWVISGYGIMGCSLLLNTYCMSKGIKISEVSIIESLSYLFVPILSFLMFKERLSLKKIGAIVVIIIGILIFFI